MRSSIIASGVMAMALAGTPGCRKAAEDKSADSAKHTGYLNQDGNPGTSRPLDPKSEVLKRCAEILHERWHKGLPEAEERDIYQQLAGVAGKLTEEDLEELMLTAPKEGDLLSQVTPVFSGMALASKSTSRFLSFIKENKLKFEDVDIASEGLRVCATLDSAELTRWVKENYVAEGEDPIRYLCSFGLAALAVEKPEEFFATAISLNLNIPGPFIALTEQDPVAFLKMLKSYPPDSPVIITAAQTLAVEISTTHPEIAMEAMKGLPPGSLPYPANMFLAEWQRLDMKKAAQFAMQLPSSTVYALIDGDHLKTKELVQANPQLARQIVDEVPATEANRENLKKLVVMAAEAEPAATFAWVKEMGSSPFASDLLRSSSEQVFRTLPPGADPLSYLPAPAAEGRGEILQGLADAAGEKAGSVKEVDGILSLSGQLPQGDRESFLTTALERGAGKAPEAVIAALADDEVTGTLSSASLAKVSQDAGQAWAKSDLQAATQWADSQPEGGVKTALVTGIVKSWGSQDFDAAEKWLTDLPAGSSRSAGAAVLADLLAPTDPERSAKWKAAASR